MKLGILGGGQLARMLALSAHPLGIKTVCLDTNPKACSGDVTQLITADFNDQTVLDQFLADVDYVTFETENIPLSCAEYVATKKTIYPSVKALKLTQDRYYEKSFLNSLDIPTASFFSVATQDELTQATSQLGLPLVLKTRTEGYDGKGQYIIKSAQDIVRAWQTLQSQTLIVEKKIDFEYELSIIAIRNRTGEISFYPLAKNHHEEGILRFSEAPFEHAKLQNDAQEIVTKILNALEYVGVITIEFFYDGEKLLVNEIAPRVHNSGHWTIEGAHTSQFENHLRAIFDLPLGLTKEKGYSLLINCIGTMPPAKSCLHIPGTHYHTYAKSPRPGRKLGHVTMVDDNLTNYQDNKQVLTSLILKHKV